MQTNNAIRDDVVFSSRTSKIYEHFDFYLAVLSEVEWCYTNIASLVPLRKHNRAADVVN